MKTKLIIPIVLLLVVFVSCKKKDCITKWWYPEGEGITVDITGYNKCSDIAKKFSFVALDDDCDKKRMNELLEYDGDTLNIYGCFQERIDGLGYYMFLPGEDVILEVPSFHCDSDIKTDSTVYYTRGVLKLFLHDQNLDFMKGLANTVYFYPVSYIKK